MMRPLTLIYVLRKYILFRPGSQRRSHIKQLVQRARTLLMIPILFYLSYILSE